MRTEAFIHLKRLTYLGSDGVKGLRQRFTENSPPQFLNGQGLVHQTPKFSITPHTIPSTGQDSWAVGVFDNLQDDIHMFEACMSALGGEIAHSPLAYKHSHPPKYPE